MVKKMEIQGYKNIHTKIDDFKKQIEQWIKEEKDNGKKEKRKPLDPAVDTRDLERILSYDSSDKKDWMPRHIRDKMRDKGIHLKKKHGYTLVKIILSDKKVNTFGKENAKGQRKDL
jgi:hypothetical protein